MIQFKQKGWSILRSSPWRPVCYCYSPSGVKERTGLVSLLLSLLASLLQPWLILGRGIRLPRANATRVTTQQPRRDKDEGRKTGRKSSGVRTKWTRRQNKKDKGAWRQGWMGKVHSKKHKYDRRDKLKGCKSTKGTSQHIPTTFVWIRTEMNAII